MHYVLDGDGNPVPEPDLITWAEWMQRADENQQRSLAKDDVGDVLVSTVFLGTDHNFGDGALPVLWETMIFGGEHDQYQGRYCSRENAEMGHKRALEMVRISRQGLLGAWKRLYGFLRFMFKSIKRK